MKRELHSDRLNNFKIHFRKFKKGYFLGRGFITFKSHKMACEMKEIYKKAYKDKNLSLIDKILKMAGKLVVEEESKARTRFRNIVLKKIIEPNSKQKGKNALSRTLGILLGGSGNKFNQKASLLRQEAGQSVAHSDIVLI